MKKTLLILSAVFLVACHEKRPLIHANWVDSLPTAYPTAPLIQANDRDLMFWKKRIDSGRPGELNESRYAGKLVVRFRQTGEIADIEEAEAEYTDIDSLYRHRLAGPLLALASTFLYHHRFADAATLLQQAIGLGVEQYPKHNISFDVLFEVGRYIEAAYHLNQLKYFQDFNYYFRKAKYDHLMGDTDSALVAITRACDRTNDVALKSLALSDKGDLLLHTGDFSGATQSLQEAFRLNPMDMHTLLNIGWIALVHDQDTLLARQIFQLAGRNNKLPDPFFRLYQLSQWRNDPLQSLYYAREFVIRATDPRYGNMYNKYLIELYTGILNQPGLAEQIARNELKNRATPQTFAWYAYTLYINNKIRQAYEVLEQNVSGKPLEAIELYYAGKVLKAAGKGYDAATCFNAAHTNWPDLSPAMLNDIRQSKE